MKTMRKQDAETRARAWEAAAAREEAAGNTLMATTYRAEARSIRRESDATSGAP